MGSGRLVASAYSPSRRDASAMASWSRCQVIQGLPTRVLVATVLAQALTAAFRARLSGYAAATPDTIQHRFLETPGQIITSGDTITIRLERRAYSPVLRKANLPAATTVPWWGNRTLRYGLA